MRTIWRVLVRTVFWSFERGTWPYDVAVVLIVAFVLLTPRAWFNDRPAGYLPSPVAVQLRDAAPGGVQIYRVDARMLAISSQTSGPELEQTVREALRKNVGNLQKSSFEIVKVDPVRGDHGAITHYDVSIRP